MGSKTSTPMPAPTPVPTTLTVQQQNALLQTQVQTCTDTYNSFQTQAYNQKAVYDSQIAQLNKQVKDVTDQLNTCTTNLANSTAKASNLSSELTTSQKTLAEAQARVTTLTSQINSLNNQLTSANTNITALDAKITELTTQRAQAIASTQSALAQIATLTQQLQSVQTTASSTSQQLQDLTKQLNVLQTTIRQLQVNSQALTLKLNETQTSLDTCNGSNLSYQQKVEELQGKIDACTIDLTASSVRNSQLSQDNDLLVQAQQGMQSQNSTLLQQAIELQNTIEENTADIDTLTQIVNENATKILNLQQEIINETNLNVDYRGQIDKLVAEINDAITTIQTKQSLVDQCNSDLAKMQAKSTRLQQDLLDQSKETKDFQMYVFLVVCFVLVMALTFKYRLQIKDIVKRIKLPRLSRTPSPVPQLV